MRAVLRSKPALLIVCASVAALLACQVALAQEAAKPAGKPAAPRAGKPNTGSIDLKVRQQGPAGKAQVMPLADDGSGPDIAALRYYVAQGQKDRVEAEIKRLKQLYPNWHPPGSIYDTHAAGAVDEQPFWDLYAAGEMDLLRTEIAKRMKDEPGWKPSPDLADKIRRKEMRIKITGMWKAGKWKDLVAYVKDAGYGGDEADVDIMWTVAEAYARTKQTDSALNIYKAILKNNANPDHRLATVQKAMATLRMVDVEQLIEQMLATPNGASELKPIKVDITRARISAYLHNERKEEVPDDDVQAFKEHARTSNDPNQSGLIAWYNYKRKILPEALEWFKFAISRGGDSMIAHGLAHTLRELKLDRDTEEVAYAWRQPLVNNAILFIDILERDLTKQIPPYIEPPRLLRYAQVTMDSAAGEGAQALGWYAYNTCQFQTALLWFQHAVAWHPKETTVYGLAITLRRLKMEREFWDLINRYDGLFPKVIEIIYPDDYYHPPTPCDVLKKRGAKAALAELQRRQARTQQAFTPYNGLAAAQQFDQLQPLPPGLTPAWQTQPALNHTRRLRKNIREPRISRRLFPVSVDGQNPMRRFPVGRLMGKPDPAAIRQISTRQPSTEPVRPMKQLVARRVPGVGPMPYERWGYQLLAAYNGKLQASPPHKAVHAPKGTLWTTLHVKDAQSTLGGMFDPDVPGGAERLANVLQAIDRAPTVPTPAQSRSGAWSAPNAYKSQEQLDAEKDPSEMLAQRKEEAPKAAPIIRASLTQAATLKLSAPATQATPAAPAAQHGTKSRPQTKAVAAPASGALQAAPPSAPMTSLAVVEDTQGARSPTLSGLRIETGARDPLGRQATDLYNARKYNAALKALNMRAATLPETSRLTMLRAWTLLNLRRVDEAREAFASIGRTAPAGSNRSN